MALNALGWGGLGRSSNCPRAGLAASRSLFLSHFHRYVERLLGGLGHGASGQGLADESSECAGRIEEEWCYGCGRQKARARRHRSRVIVVTFVLVNPFPSVHLSRCPLPPRGLGRRSPSGFGRSPRFWGWGCRWGWPWPPDSEGGQRPRAGCVVAPGELRERRRALAGGKPRALARTTRTFLGGRLRRRVERSAGEEHGTAWPRLIGSGRGARAAGAGAEWNAPECPEKKRTWLSPCPGWCE